MLRKNTSCTVYNSPIGTIALMSIGALVCHAGHAVVPNVDMTTTPGDSDGQGGVATGTISTYNG